MKKIIKFFHRYLFKEPRYFFTYVMYRVFDIKNQCSFYTDQELGDLIASGKSLIRFGDGEMGHARGLPMPFGHQRYVVGLKEDVIKIIKGYGDQSNYILAIPTFVNYSNAQLERYKGGINILDCWTPLRSLYGMIFNKKVKYGDAHFFYRDGNFQKYILPYLRKKKIVVIAKESIKEKVMRSDIGGNVVSYISCPDVDAYEKKFDIVSAIKGLSSAIETPPRGIVILFAAGAAKMAIFDLSRLKYQAIDMGMGFDSFFNNESIEYRL